MTQEQTGDVRAMTRAAGITPTVTRIDGPRHPMLTTLAPGERVLVAGGIGEPAPVEKSYGGGGGGGGRGRSGGGRRSGGGGGQPRSGGAKPAAGNGNRSRRRKPQSATTSSSSGRPHNAASFSGRR